MRLLKSTILAALVLPLLSTGCYTTQSGKSKFTFIPGRADTVPKRYDQPVETVFGAAREAIELVGTLTSEERTKNVLTGRVNSRYVWIKVMPDEQSPENISAVHIQVRTKYGNPDLLTASEMADQTTLAIIRAVNKTAAANPATP